jgi:hypothetical protein
MLGAGAAEDGTSTQKSGWRSKLENKDEEGREERRERGGKMENMGMEQVGRGYRQMLGSTPNGWVCSVPVPVSVPGTGSFVATGICEAGEWQGGLK